MVNAGRTPQCPNRLSEGLERLQCKGSCKRLIRMDLMLRVMPMWSVMVVCKGLDLDLNDVELLLNFFTSL